MSKATTAGTRDADDWMSETPKDDWEDAIKPGVLGADEGLINALGSTEAAQYLGVRTPYRGGTLTRAAATAFEEYSRAWKARVQQALQRRRSSSLSPRRPTKPSTRHHSTRKPPAPTTITQTVASLGAYASPYMLKELGFTQRQIEAAVRQGKLIWRRNGHLEAA